jgi:hypothetical protein
VGIFLVELLLPALHAIPIVQGRGKFDHYMNAALTGGALAFEGIATLYSVVALHEYASLLSQINVLARIMGKLTNTIRF